jgi:hypothetical protein
MFDVPYNAQLWNSAAVIERYALSQALIPHVNLLLNTLL